MIKTVIVLGGMSSLFAVLLYKVYSFDFWENGVRERNKTSKVNIFIFDKHPWGIPFVILIWYIFSQEQFRGMALKHCVVRFGI